MNYSRSIGVKCGSFRSQSQNLWAKPATFLPLGSSILDEFGYLPVDSQIGPALYELMAARYERRATVIISNKSLRK